jgi:hypothetical protein
MIAVSLFQVPGLIKLTIDSKRFQWFTAVLTSTFSQYPEHPVSHHKPPANVPKQNQKKKTESSVNQRTTHTNGIQDWHSLVFPAIWQKHAISHKWKRLSYAYPGERN